MLINSGKALSGSIRGATGSVAKQAVNPPRASVKDLFSPNSAPSNVPHGFLPSGISPSPLAIKPPKPAVAFVASLPQTGVKCAVFLAGVATAATVAHSAALENHSAAVRTAAERGRDQAVEDHVVKPFNDLSKQIENKNYAELGLSGEADSKTVDLAVRKKFGEIVDKALETPELKNSSMLKVLGVANKVASILFPLSGEAATQNIADWVNSPSTKELFTMGEGGAGQLKELAAVYSSQVSLPNGPTETAAHVKGSERFPEWFHQVAVKSPPQVRGLLAVAAYLYAHLTAPTVEA